MKINLVYLVTVQHGTIPPHTQQLKKDFIRAIVRAVVYRTIKKLHTCIFCTLK